MEAWRFGFDPSLPPAFKFDPTDADLVAYYLLPRALNIPNNNPPYYAHAVVDADPGSCPPWELLRRHGHAFFFGPPRDPRRPAGRGRRRHVARAEGPILDPPLWPVLARVKMTDAGKKKRPREIVVNNVPPCQEDQNQQQPGPGPSSGGNYGHHGGVDGAGNAVVVVSTGDGAGTSTAAQGNEGFDDDDDVAGEPVFSYTDLLLQSGEDSYTDDYFTENMSDDYLNNQG
ncbi:hypothetical protein QOZ80_9AG0670970 [Eleusine coracana subsp. coracana]|nr:hypothetical protein QOZ80_9AG0670970 [Eleusine coracana subsp. coracana]